VRHGVLVVVGAALLAAGCGAATSDEGAPAEIAVPRGTYRMETVSRVAVAGQTHEFRTTIARDDANHRTSTVDATTGCRTITIVDTTYTEVPEPDGAASGKPWVRTVYDRASAEELFEQSYEPPGDDEVSVSISRFAFGSPSGPGQYLDELRAISAELEVAGTDEVRGVPTTRYRTTVSSAVRDRRMLEREGWKQVNIDRYLAQAQPHTEEVEVWLDPEGRVRRIVTTVPGRMETVTTTEYYDFGADIEIEAPPADEVFDLAGWQSYAPLEPESPQRCLH
jgi:hypothetical protein